MHMLKISYVGEIMINVILIIQIVVIVLELITDKYLINTLLKFDKIL
jgi:hypothetical protein